MREQRTRREWVVEREDSGERAVAAIVSPLRNSPLASQRFATARDHVARGDPYSFSDDTRGAVNGTRAQVILQPIDHEIEAMATPYPSERGAIERRRDSEDDVRRQIRSRGRTETQ